LLSKFAAKRSVICREGRIDRSHMASRGARAAGLIAPMTKTLNIAKARPTRPKVPVEVRWTCGKRFIRWATRIGQVITIKGEDIAQRNWDRRPEDVLPITAKVPPDLDVSGRRSDAAKRAMEIHGPDEGWRLPTSRSNRVHRVLHTAASKTARLPRSLEGQKIKECMASMIRRVGLVRAQAEEEGLPIFQDGWFRWRLAGCSMCLWRMNPDQLAPGERLRIDINATSRRQGL